jgi:hypothetical protein
MPAAKLLACVALIATTALAAERNEVIVRSFPASPGKRVLVDAGPLDLAVRSAAIDEIRVKVELAAVALKETQAVAWLDTHRPVIEDTGEELRLRAPDPRGIKLFKGVIVTRARIELVLPPGVRPDLSSSSANIVVEGEFTGGGPLRLRSASGDVEFTGWANEVEARSTSGDLHLRATRALDHLLARSASGVVLLTGGARSARCDTSSGDVRLAGLLGATGIATTSGSITASFDALPDDVEVRIASAAGKVRVTLPPGTQPGGELASARGEIRSAYPGASSAREPRLTLAGAGARVFITTTSGRIELF